MDALGQIFLSTIERLSSFGGKNVLPLYRLVHWKVSFIQRCPLSGSTVYGGNTFLPLKRGQPLHFELCGYPLQRYINSNFLGSSPSNFEQVSTGGNRPIPKGDMHDIETQLRHHVHEERRREEHRGDLLRADPYQQRGSRGGRGGSHFGGMTDSTVTSADMFYSLNLHDSFSETLSHRGNQSLESSVYTETASSTMGDSYVSSAHSHRRSPESVYRRCEPYTTEDDNSTALDSIPLSGGCGLEQLVTPTHSRRRKSSGSTPGDLMGGGGRGGGGGKRGRITQQDVCKYSLTLSGVTVAILQANPVYTHPTDKHRHQSEKTTNGPSSLDGSGLDPLCYLSEVSEVLKCGVNRREVQRQQEGLAQALPLDHLL